MKKRTFSQLLENSLVLSGSNYSALEGGVPECGQAFPGGCSRQNTQLGWKQECGCCKVQRTAKQTKTPITIPGRYSLFYLVKSNWFPPECHLYYNGYWKGDNLTERHKHKMKWAADLHWSGLPASEAELEKYNKRRQDSHRIFFIFISFVSIFILNFKKSLKTRFNYALCMCLCVHMNVCFWCPGALDSLKVELWVVVRSHNGNCKLNSSSSRIIWGLNCWAISLVLDIHFSILILRFIILFFV